MTREQLKSIPVKVLIRAQLEHGGHMQVCGNEEYGIVRVDVKPDRESDWRRYFALGEASQAARGGFDKELTFEELVEAVKDIPWKFETPEVTA